MKDKRQELIDLRQLFRRNSDCYADTHTTDKSGNYVEGEVIMAMTEDNFLKAIAELKSINSASDESQSIQHNEPTQEFALNLYCTKCGNNIEECNVPYDTCVHSFNCK